MPRADARQRWQDISGTIDYADAYARRGLQLRGNRSWRQAKCPFHGDTRPSMSINIRTGHFKCHGCDKHGDLAGFDMLKRGITFSEAVANIGREVGVDIGWSPRRMSGVALAAAHELVLERHVAQLATVNALTVDGGVVTGAHSRLLRSPEHMRWLAEKRGLTRETVEHYQLGHDGERFCIPIPGPAGTWVNVRRYKPGAASQGKMLSWGEGFGQTRLFPLSFRDRPTDEAVYLFEGEMDTLLALQHGLNAVTGTGGASTWRDEWTQEFTGRDVVICYDCDEAGQRGAARIAGALHGVAARVRVVDLGLSTGEDFTDYLVTYDRTKDDFQALVDSTPPYRPSPVEQEATHIARTDLGNEQRLVAHLQERAIYVTDQGWFIWTGTHWTRDTEDLVAHWTKELPAIIQAEADAIQEDI